MQDTTPRTPRERREMHQPYIAAALPTKDAHLKASAAMNGGGKLYSALVHGYVEDGPRIAQLEVARRLQRASDSERLHWLSGLSEAFERLMRKPLTPHYLPSDQYAELASVIDAALIHFLFPLEG